MIADMAIQCIAQLLMSCLGHAMQIGSLSQFLCIQVKKLVRSGAAASRAATAAASDAARPFVAAAGSLEAAASSLLDRLLSSSPPPCEIAAVANSASGCFPECFQAISAPNKIFRSRRMSPFTFSSNILDFGKKEMLAKSLDSSKYCFCRDSGTAAPWSSCLVVAWT